MESDIVNSLLEQLQKSTVVLPHGRAISAEQFELEVGRGFSVERFASLCNSIALWIGRQSGLAQVAFTERVNVADNGIDADWCLESPISDRHSTPIVGPGWNVLQYKKRDVTAQDRKKTIADLVASVKGALKRIAETEHRFPDRYALFTNVHLTRKEKERLEEAIKTGCDHRVDILSFGAAEIAAFTNGLPHIRSGYFATNDFSDWSSAWNSHSRQKMFGSNVELTGRANLLEQIKKAVDDTDVRIAIVSGPPEIGKSRIVFEATRHRALETTVALDSSSTSVADLLALRGESGEVLAIVEDLEFDAAAALANAVLGPTGIKLILAVPTGDSALGVNFGLDPRLKHIPLQGLSDQDSSTLLRLAGAKLNYSVESWVVQQAGGSPGILLSAARTPDMLSSAESFTDQIARSFERRVMGLYGEKGTQAIRVISLLTYVGFRDHRAQEIKRIAEFMAVRLDDVLDSARELEAAGIVRTRGSFLEAVPPLFASYEATQAIRGRAAELSSLLVSLDADGRARLIRRLRTLHGSEIGAFWSEFFAEHGPFSNFDSALHHASLLHLIAPAVPDAAADLICNGLSSMSRDDRLAIQGPTRRELMWTLDELLFRPKTSERALKSVALLAEAENESIGNSATGVFVECFHPRHPQFPLRLGVRIDVLRDAVDSSRSEAMNILGVKAIAAAFHRYGGVLLRRGDGPAPLGSRPEMTWGDLWRYYGEIAELVLNAARSPRAQVCREARRVLPRVLSELIIQTPPLDSTRWCAQVVGAILNGELEVSINDLTDFLILAMEGLDAYPEDRPGKDEARESSNLLQALLSEIDGADFPTRLKRWIGGHHSGKREKDQKGNLVFESESRIEDLAREAVSNTGLLKPGLLDWLISDQAKQNWLFFYRLGEADKDAHFLPTLVDLAKHDGGASAFGSYFGGLSEHRPTFVSDCLDELAREGAVKGRAIIYATQSQTADCRSIERLRLLMNQNLADPNDVCRLLSGGGWSRPLTADECSGLLETAAGPNLENAGAVIGFLAMWIHGQKPVIGRLADLAWRCLEAMPAQVDMYDSELLAAALVGNDPDRAFRLFELLMTQPYNKSGWQPIDHHSTRNFWDALHQADRSRLIRIAFNFDQAGATRALNLSWHLPGVINWEEDKEILRAIALESEARAGLILECAPRVGLWPLAIELLERFPQSKRIKSEIASRAQHDREVICGSTAVHYSTCADEIQAVLEAHSKLPFRVKAFLEELRDRFKEAAKKEHQAEEDEDVNR